MPAMSHNPSCPTAILRGSRFPCEPFSFTIHSVFTSALNLSLPHDELLASIIVKKNALHPRALLLDCERQNNCDFLQMGIKPGISGICNEDGLNFDTGLHIAAGSSCKTVASGIVRLELLQDRHSASLALAVCCARLSMLQKEKNTDLAIDMLLFDSPLKSDVSGQRSVQAALSETIRALGKAIEKSDLDAAVQQAISLIGLGQGLTPSGDDFLTGFVYALQCIPIDIAQPGIFNRKQFLYRLRRLLIDNPRLTNDISRTFLLLSLSGDVSEGLLLLASAFVGGFSLKKFEFALQDLSSFGHSSGLDAACGFLYGLLQYPVLVS